MARISVRVHPRAKRSAVTGRLGDAYKVALAAPPVDGKANDECIRFLAEVAGVPPLPGSNFGRSVGPREGGRN